MPSRVVRVYDAPVPSVDDIMFGDPATRPPFPDEAWAQKMETHEIALFCVNFKSETPVREDTGRPGPQSDETCRIFANVQEARSYAEGIVKDHPSTLCILRSKDERVVKRISNRRFMRKFAFASLLGMGLWPALATGIGLAMIVLVRTLVRRSGFQWILVLTAGQWFALLVGALVLGAVALALKLYLGVRRKINRLHQAIGSSLSPEEKARFAEVNALAVSSDPKDRSRAREFTKEYHDRIMQIRQDMK
jgi:hypothetical protein